MIAVYPHEALETAAWIDLLDPTPEEVQRVHDATGLRVPTRDEMSEIESSSRLGFDLGAYYVTTPLVTPSDGHLELAPLGFVLSARVLLTVRFRGIRVLDDARLNCAKLPEATAEAAFVRILETVVDHAADALEHAGSECDALSRRVFHVGGPKGSEELRAAIRQIGSIANHAAQIGDALLGVERIAAFVSESKLQGAPVVDGRRMKAVRADVASLTDYESRLSANVQFVLDATLGFISIEQNEIVKTLTIASVVGIPPVIVAGIYGMNFRFMPELSWHLGYPVALGVIVLSAVIPWLWFKKGGRT